MRPFGDPGGDFDLAVGLSRVLFPIVVLLGLSGIVVGILNTYHQFAVPGLAPVAWNLVIIVGLLLGVPRIDDESAQLYLYSGVVVLGTLVMLLLPFPWLRKLDGRLTMVLDWRDPAVRRVLTLMLPVTLTIGLVNVNFRRHAVRVPAPRPRACAGSDRQGVPPLHAIKLYRTFEGDIDLVLTDLSLPEVDGWQVCRQIRSLNPRVKLMVTTGAMDARIESELKKQGIQGFIQKPCSAEDMVEKMRTVLERAS